MGGGPAGSQRRLTYGGLQQLPVLAGAVLWSRAIPLLLKLLLVLFNECALGAAYPVERDLVVVAADVFQLTYCPLERRKQPRSLTVEQFQKLSAELHEPHRTI